jgi:hypothetical protein
MADINCQDMQQDSLTVASYNCRGYNTYVIIDIQQILEQCSLLCLHGSWFSDSQLSALSSISNNFLCIGISGFDTEEILTGRSYGGCAVLWRYAIGAQVDINEHSRRLCDVKFEFSADELHVNTT